MIKVPFTFQKTDIPDVLLIKSAVFNDKRGFFCETYRYDDLAAFGIKERFKQDNHSLSFLKGTIRGLHYQINDKAQSKLVRVAKGGIFDVAVDIRKSSPTYGKWVGIVLTADEKISMYIPQGFAHGFCTLEDNTEVFYKCGEMYSPEHERGIIWNDKDLKIKWPVDAPILSPKDKLFPPFRSLDNDV